MGILDTGIDPQTAGLLAAAFQGLQASGPSRVPQGLGQVIGQAGQAGLETYGQTRLANLKEGLTSLQLQKLQADIDLQKNFAASGLLKNMSDADRLESLGTQMSALGHPGGAGLIARAEQIRKRKSEEDTLASFKSKEGQGGLFGPLLESPYVGGAAKQLQQTLDTTSGVGISPAVFTQRFDALQKEHLAQMSQNPNVHVVSDDSSPTKWSYKDMRTGKMLSTGAPQPATAVDPANVESTAQGIAKGQLAPLSSWAMKTPQGAAIMSRVMEINPDYSAKDFSVQQTGEKAFTSGKQGNTVRSFNVAINHLGTLDKAIDALGNGDVKLFNKFTQTYSEQTGNPAPTNFDAVRKIVGDEIVKAIVGSGGGVTDREEAAKTINRANSPQALKGAIGQYKELMAGQLGGLRTQYEASTGKKDFDQRFLTTEALRTISNKGTAPALPAGIPAGSKVIGKSPQGQDVYQSPDGKKWIP